MTLSSFNLLVFFISLTFLLAQTFVRKKHTSHILFGVFCGSIAMTLAQNITGDSIGAYKHLIGLGTVATCNCYWLLSRSLFRKKNAIASQHLALAFAISLLLFIKQGYLFTSSANLIAVSGGSLASTILSEFTILLSSCTLVLSFWEGARGYQSATKKEKGQRILFLASFCSAVIISKLSFVALGENPIALEWVITSLILLVLISTQILMFWRYREPNKVLKNNLIQSEAMQRLQQAANDTQDKLASNENRELAEKVKTILIEQQLFLQANLKVGDIAKILSLPEYRISKAIRNHLNAKNFNQYVNELRINYAQEILVDQSKQQWSVLVVGLESGFGSVGPFTRAFKVQTGFTPNQYRQFHMDNLALNAG